MDADSKVQYVSPGFYELICDASCSLFLAKEATDEYTENRLARSSILSAAMSVECFSNCLIRTMAVSKNTRNNLDRLTAMAKIDVFLEFSGEKPLVQGNSDFQKIKDLGKLRNAFVHAKKSSNGIEIRGMTKVQDWRYPDRPEIDSVINPSSFKALGVSESSYAWFVDDAHSVLLAVSIFIKNILCNLNEKNGTEAWNELATRLEIDSDNGLLRKKRVDEISFEVERLSDFGIDFGFLMDLSH